MPPNEVLQRARHSPRVQHIAQWGLILALIVAAFAFETRQNSSDDAQRTEAGRTTTLEAMLAQACNAANFAELKQREILAECRLAQQGDLPSAIPESAIPSPDVAAGQVPANVIPDNTSVPPPAIPAGTPAVIEEAVSGYFATHELPVTATFERALTRATARFLTDHPPTPGRTPTRDEVANVVTAVLLANPPPPGQDGTPGTPGASGASGTSVTQATLDGCNVVFTLSDGSTNSVGPVCGQKGDPGAEGQPGPGPTDAQIQQGFTAFCQVNNQCQGPTGVVRVVDNCAGADPGNFVTNVNASYDADTQTITLSCDQGSVLGGGPG